MPDGLRNGVIAGQSAGASSTRFLRQLGRPERRRHPPRRGRATAVSAPVIDAEAYLDDQEVDIRLVGFAGFGAGERFLRALDDEIWLARWGRRRKLHVHRPTDLCTADAVQRELELPCQVTVISAHAGPEGAPEYFSSGGRPDRKLYVDSIGELGAASLILVDACWAERLFERLRHRGRRGTQLVGLAGQDREAHGRDSVTVIADVLRELCCTSHTRLDQEAVVEAVGRANAQVAARNAGLGLAELRPHLAICPC